MMSKISIFCYALSAVGLCLVFSCASTVGLQPPDAYETKEQAIAEYEKALAENPQDAKTNFWLGMLLVDGDQIDVGKQYLTRAVELDPSLTEAHLRLGKFAEEEKDIPGAIAHYDRAIQGNPLFDEIVRRRSAVYRKKDTALRRLDNANALLIEGKYEEAIEILDRAHAELGNEPRVAQLKARALVALGRIEQPYERRKELFIMAKDLLESIGSADSASTTLLSEIETLLEEDEDQVAHAREQIEGGGGTFQRELCLAQKAPLVEIKNNSRSQITLDLRFRGDVRQTVIAADGASLRSGPGSDYDRIANLSLGVPVWVKLRGDEFYNVVTPEGEGWVSSRLLMNDRSIKLPVPAGRTVIVFLAPGTADYRLGRGIRTIAEGSEEFIPYLSYHWP